MTSSSDLGKEGESIAVKYLKEKGYFIETINWRYKHNEIDIIARYEKVLVFIEVKTRQFHNTQIMQPFESVNRKKQRAIIKAANAFITEKALDYDNRFDIISVKFFGKNYAIEHIEDAFYPIW